jgi:hypothetical protein
MYTRDFPVSIIKSFESPRNGVYVRLSGHEISSGGMIYDLINTLPRGNAHPTPEFISTGI